MSEINLNKTLKKIIIFASCMTLFLLVTGIGVAHVYITTFNDATEERMHEEVNNYKERIVRQIDRKFQIINSMAALIGTTNMPGTEEFKEALQVSATQNSFLILGYWDVNSANMATVIDDRMFKEQNLEEIQPEIQDVLEGAIQGENIVSDAFKGKLSDEMVFVMGTPVYHEGEIIGALVASDTIDAFSSVLNQQSEFYGGGFIHLIDYDGDFIIRGKESAVKEDIRGILQPPYIDEHEADEIRSKMAKEEMIHFSFTYEHKKYNALLEPLNINGWYLFCVNSTQNVNQNIYKLLYVAAAFFIFIVVLFFFTLRYGYSTMKQVNGKLRKLAYYDSLTGIYNMNRFTELAENAVKEQKQYAVAVLNVRHFKFVNEFFRREEADKILKQIGEVLENSVRDGEYACRESADYFYLFLKETDHTVLEERFNNACRQISSVTGGMKRGFRIIMRCGIATSKTNTELQDTIIHAMFALAKTKEDHKRNIWFFDTELHEQEQYDNYIENNARKALENGEFKLYLQPKVSLKDDTLAGAEALVRWEEGNGNLLFPGDFIPIFERNGFCTALDMYMFEKVCQQLRAWIDAGYTPVPISINQSKLTFYEENYEEKLRACLEKYNIPASLITLEVLEGLAMDDVEQMNLKLESLREIGFKISMDDFGSGYSSLNTLGKLKIDEVKLDRGFLMEAMADNGKNTRVIMEAVVRMSKQMSISTVIEGIETDQNEEFVKEINGDIGQGYLYSRPVNAETFTDDILLTSSLNADFSGGGGRIDGPSQERSVKQGRWPPWRGH